MAFLLTSLPDDLLTWQGTVTEFIDRTRALLPQVGLADDADSINERLVRYYQTEGVLTPPGREGRESVYGGRQVVELLVARYLVKDGWRLSMIAELLRNTDLPSLQTLLPGDRPRTRAEELVAGFKRPRTSSPPPASTSVGRARELRLRQSRLRDLLRGLGNEDGTATRRNSVHLSLTSWCEVQIDTAQLARLDEKTAEALGTALTYALLEERSKRGKTS